MPPFKSPHVLSISKILDKLSINLYITGHEGSGILGSSQEEIRKFPAEARRDAGFQLHFVQMGQEPSDWKPMKTVGSGAVEIRIHKEGEWRIIYVARFQSKVYVLHAFEKKTGKTRQSDLSLARQRYKEVEYREKAKQKTRR